MFLAQIAPKRSIFFSVLPRDARMRARLYTIQPEKSLGIGLVFFKPVSMGLPGIFGFRVYGVRRRPGDRGLVQWGLLGARLRG